MHSRSYGNLSAGTTFSGNGYGWQDKFRPQLIVRPGTLTQPGWAVLAFDPGKVFQFNETPGLGSFVAMFFWAARVGLRYDDSTERWIVATSNGRQYFFRDPDEGPQETKIFVGTMERDGSLIETTYETSGARRLLSITRDSGDTSFAYTYVGAAELIATVTLTVNGQAVRRAAYTYYDAPPGGTAGDVKTATIECWNATTEDWEVLTTSFYRYYVTNEAPGFVHGLKFALGPEAYARFRTATDNMDPEDASDELLAEFADYYFEYDNQRRVIMERTRAGAHTYRFSYASNPNLNGAPVTDDFNTWFTRTVVTQPDNTQEVVYSNRFAQVILKVHRTPEGESCRYWRYNDQGQALLAAEPSAVASYDESQLSLVQLHPHHGLVRFTDYYSSAADDGAPTRRKSIRLREGENGDDVFERKWHYLSHEVGDQTYYFPWKDIQYVGPEGAIEEAVTTYSYTWYADTRVVQQRTTTLPAVSTSQNGSGTANQIVEEFDQYGNRESRTDERGFVQEWTWEPALHGITKHVVDPSGLNLVTDCTLDEIGRTTAEFGPLHATSYSLVRRLVANVYLDTAFEQRTGQGYGIDTSIGLFIGPITITRTDHIGRTVEKIQAILGADDPLDAPIGQSQYCRWEKFTFDNQSRLTTHRLYHRIPPVGDGEEGFDYGETRFSYDAFSRQIAVQSAAGTITRTVLDSRGRPIESWIGTNDAGATATDPNGAGTTGNNMVRVETREYDRGVAAGDGLLTEIVAFTGIDDARVTTFDYDFRGRRTVTRGEHGFRETYASDNVGHAILTELWNDEGVTPLRVSKDETLYDSLGRGYRTIRYSVDPLTGLPGTALSNDTWFDPAGNVMKRRNPEDAGFEKLTYDAAGRLTHRYAGYNTLTPRYAEAQSVANDSIFDQTDYTIDPAGNVIQETRRERFHDTTGVGSLGDATGAAPNARVLYTLHYPDPLGHIIATVQYGTNGGTAPSRPSSVPPRSDTVLVTSFDFNDRGELFRTTDPKGTVANQTFDDAGRLIRTVENVVSSGTTLDQNRTTEFTYTLDGQLAILIARNQTTGDQITRWHYGTTLAESAIASNSLVRAKVCPDSDDPGPGFNGPDTVYDRLEFRYNRLGQAIEQKDQNGTVHAYDYDHLGRLLHDRVSTVGTGIDSTVRRISRTYDQAGRLQSISSWSEPQITAGSILNQVLKHYNGFGQLLEESQSHDGAVNPGTTAAVRYTYADGTNRHIRRLSTIYPDNREIAFSYGTSGGADDALGRVQEIQDASNGNAPLARYTRRGLSATMRIEYPATGTSDPIEMTYIKQSGEPNGDAGDQYTGQDRFNRIIDIRYLRSGTTTHVDRIQYGFDRASNRLWRKNVVAATNWDELYAYDGLYQLTSRKRGTLNSTRTALSGDPLDSEAFAYDPMGNWTQFTQNQPPTSELIQSRQHNRANEILSITVDNLSRFPGYDRAGNMRTFPKVGDWAANQTAVWDAWNRLVEIREGDTIVGTYRYDGLTRRVWKENIEDGSLVRRHFYYSDQWKVLEERLDAEVTADRQFVWGLRYIDDLILRERTTDTGVEHLYATHDQWHVISTLSSSGTTTERFAYRAFGETQVLAPDFTPRAASESNWNTTYGAYHYDAESRLYCVRYRYLHPPLGRWLSRDPGESVIGLLDSVDVDRRYYVYVANNSIVAVDPMGLAVNRPKPPEVPLPTPLPPTSPTPRPKEVWKVECVAEYELVPKPCKICALGNRSGSGTGLGVTLSEAKSACLKECEKSAQADLDKDPRAKDCQLGHANTTYFNQTKVPAR